MRVCPPPHSLGLVGPEQSALPAEQLITFIVSSPFNSVNPSCASVTRKAWCYKVPKQNKI